MTTCRAEWNASSTLIGSRTQIAKCQFWHLKIGGRSNCNVPSGKWINNGNQKSGEIDYNINAASSFLLKTGSLKEASWFTLANITSLIVSDNLVFLPSLPPEKKSYTLIFQNMKLNKKGINWATFFSLPILKISVWIFRTTLLRLKMGTLPLLSWDIFSGSVNSAVPQLLHFVTCIKM